MTDTAERFGVFDFGLDSEQEERAARLHTESVIVDILFQGPCGYRTYDAMPEPSRSGHLRTDLSDARDAANRAALAGKLADYETCWRQSGVTAGTPRQVFPFDDLRGYAIAQAQFDTLPWLSKALTASDVRRAKADDRIAGLVSTQDTEGIDRELIGLQVAYDLGLRMIGLTYNMQNIIGGGCTERTDSGVSSLGAELIRRMNGIGMIVDTAHSGLQTTLDACEISKMPVVASHTSAAALYETDRAKSDEELRALAETGGVIGIYAVPFFLAPGSDVTIESMLDHIDYVSELVGWQHVAIGTDWPMQMGRRTLEETFLQLMPQVGFRDEHMVGTENLLGFDDYRDFPNITRGLVARGYKDEEVRGILGENFLRVFEAVCG